MLEESPARIIHIESKLARDIRRVKEALDRMQIEGIRQLVQEMEDELELRN